MAGFRVAWERWPASGNLAQTYAERPSKTRDRGQPANDEPSLSPNGQWLAFHSTRQPAGIYLQPGVPSGSGGAARLLVEGGRVPRFSPDGKWIAYLNAGESGGDVQASNTRMLYIVRAQGGEQVRLARNVSSVQGAVWTSDSRGVLFLSTDEMAALRLWSAPLDGGAAPLIPEFSERMHLSGRACAVTGDRFLYTEYDGHRMLLSEFPLKPALRASPYSVAAVPSRWEISGCAASANGTVLADAVDGRSSAWALPIDADSGAVRGSLVSLDGPEGGGHPPQFTPDGAAFLMAATGLLQDYGTAQRRELPGAQLLSSDGLFVLQLSTPGLGPSSSSRVLNLKTGESWGSMQGGAVSWDLSSGGEWVLSASPAIHRAIVAWYTKTSEHRTIYAHPSANLYLASFSQDGRWALFTSEEAGHRPRMWAAPFRGLRDVPVAEWVDLGDGDYPRWSPSGRRIYFTMAHDGFECIYTRAVDPVTKRPAGPVAEVQHFHGRLTPRGLKPGHFRISVAQDKIAFALGEQVHQLLQWR